MKHIAKILTLILAGVFSANVFAIEHDFVAGLVNRSGHVIKFYSGYADVAVAMTSGSAVHLLWKPAPYIPIHIEGLTADGKYLWICPGLAQVVANQTITVFSKNLAYTGSDFYCQVEPPIH